MSREAQAATSIAGLGERFHRRFIAWFVLGVPAFLIVAVLFHLRVAKPLALR